MSSWKKTAAETLNFSNHSCNFSLVLFISLHTNESAVNADQRFLVFFLVFFMPPVWILRRPSPSLLDYRLGAGPKRLFMAVKGRDESTITDFLQMAADAGLLLNIGAIRAGVDWKSESSELLPWRPVCSLNRWSPKLQRLRHFNELP